MVNWAIQLTRKQPVFAKSLMTVWSAIWFIT